MQIGITEGPLAPKRGLLSFTLSSAAGSTDLRLRFLFREVPPHDRAIEIEQEPQDDENKEDPGEPDQQGAEDPGEVVPDDLHHCFIPTTLLDTYGVPRRSALVLDVHLIFPIPVLCPIYMGIIGVPVILQGFLVPGEHGIIRLVKLIIGSGPFSLYHLAAGHHGRAPGRLATAEGV